MEKEIINSEVKIKSVSEKIEGHSFFGYYDVCPWDETERYILLHESGFIDRRWNEDDSVNVGMVDTKEGDHFISIGETASWNFQQGARLQWMPDEPTKVIYNIREEGKFKSLIYDIESKEERKLENPVYSLSPKGKFALSVNYSRLDRLGGYGYKGGKDEHEDDPAPEKDGIFRVDLDSGERDLIISIKEIAGFKNKGGSGSQHYLLFPTFNYAGDRFCFLHRFKLKDGGLYTRLLTANPDGSGLFLLAEGTLSHFTWFEDGHILVWGRSKPYLTKARKHKFFALPIFKPILNFLRGQVRGFMRHRVIGDQYLLFKDRTKGSTSVGKGALIEDGHPTKFGKTPWLVTDTYPDENHYRTLILYNLENNRKIDLCKLYSLPDKEHVRGYTGSADWDITGMRSDLHPRWNRSGNKICVDSVHEGKKQVHVVDVSDIVG